MKKVHKSSGTDDKKLQTSLKKMNVQPIQAIEEVNMFKEDGNVIHFAAPKGTLPLNKGTFVLITTHPLNTISMSHDCCSNRSGNTIILLLYSFHWLDTEYNSASSVHASVPSNTFAIYGNGEDKELTELVPGILNQLGPDSLASLRKLAESYQSMQKKEGEDGDKKDEDDDDIPDLVPGETFDSKVE